MYYYVSKLFKLLAAYSTIGASFVTNRHALLAPALQTARQIELDGNSTHLLC